MKPLYDIILNNPEVTHITAEINEGTFEVPREEALSHYENLAPGEPFTIISYLLKETP